LCSETIVRLGIRDYLDLYRRNRAIIGALLQRGDPDDIVVAWDFAVMFFAVVFCDDEATKRGVETAEEMLANGEL
jgi:hypothetical protein